MPAITWDHVYLLAWYDAKGHPYMTTWSGSCPPVEVVVRGYSPSMGVPLWASPVPKNCTLSPMPEGLTHQGKIDHATKEGGVYAFGWLLAEPIDRTPKMRMGLFGPEYETR